MKSPHDEFSTDKTVYSSIYVGTVDFLTKWEIPDDFNALVHFADREQINACW